MSSRTLTRWLRKIAPDKFFSRKECKRLCSFGTFTPFFLTTACDTALGFYFCQVFVFNYPPEEGVLGSEQAGWGARCLKKKKSQDPNQYESPLNTDITCRQGRFDLWVNLQAWSRHRAHLSSNMAFPTLVWLDFFIDIGFYFQVMLMTWDLIVFFGSSLCSLFFDLIFEPNKQRQYPEK